MMKLKDAIGVFVLHLLLASCVSEPLGALQGGCGDGTATRITLSVTGDNRQATEAKSRAFVPEDEGAISNLHVLVFEGNADESKILSNEYFGSLTGGNSVSTETLPGTDRTIYVVANGDVNNYNGGTALNSQLDNVATLGGLKAVLVAINGNGLSRSERLTMVGSTTVTITKPHKDPIAIQLHFLSAKVTVTVKDAIPVTPPALGITITGWDIVNIPNATYLLERAQEDGVKSYTATTADKPNPFETVDPLAKTWAQSFYLFENRRGGRVPRSLPTNPADRYPDMDKDDNNQRGKAWYAPEGATCMLIYGTHSLGGQTNNIIYKIYLGENPVDDYNLCRGKHYQYNVTINGLNDINVDTNVEWGNASFSVTTSDNLLMDAHPDYRVIRIGGTAAATGETSVLPAYATVEVTQGADWLTVSALDLYRHSIKQAGNTYQQFEGSDGVGSFVRPRYTTNAEQEFASPSFVATGKLTKIPFSQLTVYSFRDILVYAAANDGEGERTGTVHVTYYKGNNGDEKVGEKEVTFAQSPALRVSDALSMERYEESAMAIYPGGLEPQSTQTMQWGYSGATLYGEDDRFSNGNYLTAHAVYKEIEARSGMAAPAWSVTTYANYRDKYPRSGAKVTEPSGRSVTDDGYYYPVLGGSTDYFHPIYSSSAARYCHEKNRDGNGDGTIGASETVWYLPSYSDMLAIKNTPTENQGLNGTYWTSTEEGTDKCWAFTFPAGTAAAVDKTTTHRVRCVRGTGVAMSEATFESAETDNTKIKLTAEASASGLFRITDDRNFGIEWAVTSNADWLKIATDTQGTGAEATKKATGDATLYAYALTANPSKEETRAATLTFTRTVMSATQTRTIGVTQNTLTIVGGKSNCYMLPPGRELTIPVVRANESFIELTGSTLKDGTYHQLQASTKWKASLVWESSIGLVTLSEAEATGTGPAGRFKVIAADASTEGNAVVAIKNDKEEILWSWHIWVTKYDGKTTFTNNNGKRDYIFMDRALGATSATKGELSSCGLHYQWGRKDPFPGIGQEGGSWSLTDDTNPIKVYDASGTAYSTSATTVPGNAIPNNLTNAIRNPNVYYESGRPYYDWFSSKESDQNDDLWSGGGADLTPPVKEKSTFDPCPAGWRIPLWLDGTSPFGTMNEGSTLDSNGRIWNKDGGYFPLSGFYCRIGFRGVSTHAYYWTGTTIDTTMSTNIYYLLLTINEALPNYKANRETGQTVRCCKDNL